MAAKRKPKPPPSPATRAAVSVGSALGKIAGRVDAWLAQREDIAAELNAVMVRAKRMLASLGKETAEVQRQAAKTVNTVRKAATRTRRNMSTAAQKKRGAKTTSTR